MLAIFLDTETNGLNPLKHRILEIALKIVDVYTGEVKETFQSSISTTLDEWQKSDPESLKINGFSWEEVQSAAAPQAVAQKLLDLFKKHGIKRGQAVFICQNPSFDRAFFCELISPDLQESLLWPYHWLDLASMYWAKNIEKGKTDPKKFPWETGVSKDKIARASALPEEGKPHRALQGVEHLLLCYRTVVGFPGRIE